MKNWRFLSVLLMAATMAFVLAKKNQITVFLIGDSTMSIKEPKAQPEAGWGVPFVYFFDSTVTVKNLAMNGRSTKSFLAENRWKPVMDSLEEGDYVFIQFGHNDESKTKVGRYATPDEYKINLKKFITETKRKRGVPVLITPVGRRNFDSTGNVMETHLEYSALARQVAAEEHVPLIDLDKKSQALYQKLGPENSKLLFMWLVPGEHPNYPNGKQDNTHFNELGARLIAQLVLEEIRNLHLDLEKRILK